MRVDGYLELDDPPSIAIIDALPFLPRFGVADIEGGPNVLFFNIYFYFLGALFCLGECHSNGFL